MRSEIRRIQLETGITAVLVTHDQVEAMSMCDRIALMKDGKIVQLSEPTDMYDNPANNFVAGFLGNPPISFVKVQVQGDSFGFGTNKVAVSAALKPRVGGELQLGIRPEHFGPQFGSDVQGKISFVESQGREILYNVTLETGDMIRSIQPAGSRLKIGDAVTWGVSAEAVLAFDLNGDRL